MSDIKRQEFEDGYISRSKITKEFFDSEFITLPCKCGSKNCRGYGVYTKGPLNMKAYFELYCPKDKLTVDDFIFIIQMVKEYDKKYNENYVKKVLSIFKERFPDYKLDN